MNEKNLLFSCLQPDITHEVYASTAQEYDIDWDNLQPADLDDIDAYMGITAADRLSATKTYTQNSSLTVGPYPFINLETIVNLSPIK